MAKVLTDRAKVFTQITTQARQALGSAWILKAAAL